MLFRNGLLILVRDRVSLSLYIVPDDWDATVEVPEFLWFVVQMCKLHCPAVLGMWKPKTLLCLVHRRRWSGVGKCLFFQEASVKRTAHAPRIIFFICLIFLMCEYWAKIVVKSEPNKVLACY